MAEAVNKNLDFSAPLEGIKRAQNSIAERSQRISQGFNAEQDPNSPSIVEDLVGIKTDLYSIKANRAVIKVIDEVQSSILDILA